MTDPIRVAVIGAGAFGRNHLRVLHELQQARNSASPQPERISTHNAPAQTERVAATNPSSRPEAEGRSGETPVTRNASAAGTNQQSPPLVHLVAAVDADPTTRAAITERYNIPTFATTGDLLAANLNLQAATVAVPTIHHAAVATQLLEANLDVLVEKPLTATLPEADALITLAATRNRIVAAGHLERFNPAVTAALQRLTRPMFFEAHRLSIFTPRSLDVDVVLDLMIHDLDILLTMANAPVTEVRAVGLPVLSRKVDIANVRLEFASGAIANLTASRVSTEQVRKLRLFQPAQYLSLDYARQELLTINLDPSLANLSPASTYPALSPNTHPAPDLHTLPSRSAAEESALPSAGTSASQARPHPSPGLTFEKLAPPRAEPLRLELEDFLHAVQTRTPPRVTAASARKALALALDINAAIAAHASAHLF